MTWRPTALNISLLADKDPKFIEQSIVDPDAELAPGFAKGIMPDNFGDSLSPEQLDTLVKYLSQSTQGGKSAAGAQ